MRILMVSSWPPSGRPVCEYGYHLVKALAECDEVEEIIVLADTYNGESERINSRKVLVVRYWDYDSHLTLGRLVRKVREFKPTVVWFNITLGTFGTSTANLPALLTPFVLRMMRFTTLVTLHNIVDLTKMDTIGKSNWLTVRGAEIATWFLARTPVCVLLPEYEVILRQRYKARQVVAVPHGTLGQPCEEVRVPDSNTLLCFGIFGTHKKLEMLLEAMAQLYQEEPNIKLRIVGGSNSHNPTYLDALKAVCALENVEFVGYVPEADVPSEFAQAKAVVMPYVTIGGESGTLIQAGMYGKPVLISRLPLFQHKAEREGYSLNFFDYDDPGSIKEAILRLLSQPDDVLAEQGQRNLDAATKNSMDKVCRIYLRLIDEIRGKRI